MFIDRPGILLSGPMTDYCLGLERHSEWQELGPHFCPSFLVGRDRLLTCHVYAIPLKRGYVPGEASEAIRQLNETFTVARCCGRSNIGSFIFGREKLPNLALPVLRRWTVRDLRGVLAGQKSPIPDLPLFDFWWSSPHKRMVERLIVVPRGDSL